MGLDKLQSEHKRLQDLTHTNLMRLIDSELKLASTMTDLAKTEREAGDTSHAKALLEKVKDALTAVRQHLADNHVSDEETRTIEDRLQQLTKQLKATKEQVAGRTSRSPQKRLRRTALL